MSRSVLSLLGRLSIRAHVFLGFGALIILLLAICVTNDRSLRDVQSNVAAIRESAASADALSLYANLSNDARRLMEAYVTTPGAAQLVAAREAQAKARATLDTLQTSLRGELADLPAKVAQFRQAFDQVTLTLAERQKALASLAAAGARLNNFNATISPALAGQDDPAALATLRLGQSIQTLFAVAYRFALQPSSADAEIIDVESHRIRDDLSLLRDHPPVMPELTALMKAEMPAIQKFLDAVAALQASTSKRDVEAAEISRTGSEVSAILDHLRKHHIDRHDASVADAGGVIARVLTAGLIAAVAAAGLGILLATVIGTSIARLVSGITEVMSELAQGHLAVTVAGAGRRDEIGRMAKALEIFRNAALAQRELEADALRLRNIADEERSANEAARADVQRQQEKVVDALASGLDRLSKGDLTSRLAHAFPAEYEKLRVDFNATAEALQDALRTISSAALGINTGSDQIAHASDDLSRRTEQQAANLEETAAALNIITGTVKAMAASAGEAAKVVLTARDAAETSGGIVRQAVEAMGKIKGSSQQIIQIIGVIDEIAFQTNLLALNAGVEAARAGDAGRGFAVVASEVRALAQRSAEAAKEIKGLISASTAQVENGVVLVDKTGDALKGIIGKVAEMENLVRQISAASQEQATGIAEINTAVAHMDQAVQQNAAMVEESTAAAHSLRVETQGLSTMVGRFEIGASKSASPRGPVTQTPAPRPRAAPARAAVVASQAKSVLAKDWDEF